MNNYEDILKNTNICYLEDDDFIEKVEKYGDRMNIPGDGRYPIAFCARLDNGNRLIVFNKDDMNCLSTIGKDFIVGHEVAHAVENLGEIEADEWALDFLLEKGYNKHQILYELWYELEFFQDVVQNFNKFNELENKKIMFTYDPR